MTHPVRDLLVSETGGRKRSGSVGILTGFTPVSQWVVGYRWRNLRPTVPVIQQTVLACCTTKVEIVQCIKLKPPDRSSNSLGVKAPSESFMSVRVLFPKKKDPFTLT